MTTGSTPPAAAPVPEPDLLTAAADRLVAAAANRMPCAPVRNLIGSSDVEAAYAVQADVNARRAAAGGRIVGHKIGLTSKAVQAQLGVPQPDFGVLFADMEYGDGATVPVDRLLQPRVEAEIAFVLGSDLAEGPLDLDVVRRAVAYAVPSLEIVDSRIAVWDISFADTVADNASSGLFVLGPQRRTLEEFEPVAVTMEMRINGQVVSTGDGAACLGDPLNALLWLAHKTREVGEPLRAGQIALSGALGPMLAVAAGDQVSATISGLGTVSATFGQEEA